MLGQVAYQAVRGKIKQRALLIYLKALQAMRRSLILVVLVFIVLQVMVLSFFGAMFAAVWLWPEIDLTTKLWILFGVCGSLFLVPCAGLCLVFSDSVWFRLSGAKQMTEDLV